MNQLQRSSCRRFALPACALVLWALLLSFTASARAATVVGIPLSLRCPTNITLWTCSSNVVYQYPPPTVTGGCPPPYQLICVPPPGFPFPIGVTTVNCRVIDSCQNSDTCSFTITVREDTEPPVIQCPSNIVVTACPSPAGGCGGIVTYPAPTATDNSGSVAITCNPPSGSFFFCGTSIVTCTAED